MVENDWVTQMQGMRKEVRNRENISDPSFGEAINIFTKEDRRLLEVGILARGIAEVRHDWSNGRSLIDCGSTTKDEIISKEE